MHKLVPKLVGKVSHLSVSLQGGRMTRGCGLIHSRVPHLLNPTSAFLFGLPFLPPLFFSRQITLRIDLLSDEHPKSLVERSATRKCFATIGPIIGVECSGIRTVAILPFCTLQIWCDSHSIRSNPKSTHPKHVLASRFLASRPQSICTVQFRLSCLRDDWQRALHCSLP